MSWEKIQTSKNIYDGIARANHSSCVVGANLIIVFGGERSYDSRLKIRECLSDIKIFNAGKSF